MAIDPPPPQFSPAPHPFPGMRNGSLAWADFENDGDLDLFVCGDAGASFSRVYRNDDGSFVDMGIVLPAYRSSSADWADFDKDGFVDLVLTGLSDYAPAATRVFRNIGGTNLVQFALLPGVFSGRAAWGDFNNDGYPDLAITGASLGSSPGLSRVYVSNGGTNFTLFGVLSPEFYYGTVDWADYDQDGDLDLLLTGEIGDLRFGAHIYRNDGSQFSPAGQVVVASGTSGEWFDANNDGWPDLLILAHSRANSYVLLNNHAGGFTNGGNLGMLGSAAVADFNNDGFSDVLIAGYRYSTASGNFVYDLTSLYLNSGTGAWLEYTNRIANVSAAQAAWGDYDRDGRLDLVLHGQRGSGYFSYLYRNITDRTNQPPEPPTGLVATMTQDDRVELSWNAAVDADQTGGLTYNIRVGSAPGLHDIVSPMSASDGWRRIIKRGNADSRTWIALRGLQPRRTYYWSVQAIDNAFSGSQFAGEAAFVINRQPVASNQSVVMNEDTCRVITLSGADPDGDVLTSIVVTSPTNGTLSGTAPALTYSPGTNFYGVDSFTFAVNDGLTDSAPATVSISVLPVNDPPIADASGTQPLWISANGSNAPVILDGSGSFDIDSNSLDYRWYLAGTPAPMSTGMVAVTLLPVGTNLVDLVVSDGQASATNGVAVEVITLTQLTAQLIATVTSQAERSNSLVAILSAATASIDRSNPTSAINQLEAFQNMVRAQLAPLDAALADQLIAEAQTVIDALSDASPPPRTRIARFKKVERRVDGKTYLKFEATAHRTHVIEASSNLVDWEMIGVAVEANDGVFEFEDANSARFGIRFYRLISP